MPTKLPPPKPPDPHEFWYCAHGCVHPPRVHVRIPAPPRREPPPSSG